MNPESETVKQIGFGKNRIESLSDCIFAFAMTLLVIGIEVPQDLNGFTPLLVTSTLREMLPDFIHYIIAFLLIAALWVIHHMQFHKIHYADHTLLWMTIGSLLFVGLIPFSTDLVGDFPTIPLCAFIFELNLLITSALFYLQWRYATANRHLIDPAISDKAIRAGKQRAAVIPVLSAVGIVLAVAGIPWSTLVYLFAPLIFLVIHLYGHKLRGESWGF
ncbi:MAG: TMEM175 family protein [Methanomicrobiales archaeon]